MASYINHLVPKAAAPAKPVPQMTRSNSREVKNTAGGFVYQVDKWTRFERFLILGCENGTFYAGERKLTIENAKIAVECAKEDPLRAIQLILDISENGRAPKNDAAIFALALMASSENPRARDVALANLSKVCRIGTHLFQFAEAVNSLRGWGRGLRRAIGNWYTQKSADDLAYQITKYQQRNGWSNRDLLRLSHPTSSDARVTEVIKYAAKKTVSYESLPRIIYGVDSAKTASSETEIVKLIQDYGLVREHIPTQYLNSVAVWDALLEKMPMTALVRNLGKLSAIGITKPLSSGIGRITAKLMDADYVKKSRIHPFQILLAMDQYSKGHGDKGSLTWQVSPQVVQALDGAFYSAFKNVEPTGKRTLIGLDISGSMGQSYVSGTTIDCRKAAAAMAMVTVKTEPNHYVGAFTDGPYDSFWNSGSSYYGQQKLGSGFTPMDFSAYTRLDEVIRKMSSMQMGGTNCAVPMLEAIKNKLEVDTFIIYTDSETWSGKIKPVDALKEYRQKSGINAKLIVCGMTANPFTIADPQDAGMLDMVGLDSAGPAIMADFSRN